MAGFARASELAAKPRRVEEIPIAIRAGAPPPGRPGARHDRQYGAKHCRVRRHKTPVGLSGRSARDRFRDSSTAGALGAGWGRGRPRVGFVDRRYEQVTAAGNGLQDGLGVVGERNPDVADALHQRIVGHEDVGPNELHQFVFGNDAAAVARQVEQYIERFGSQRHHLACAREACRVRIKREPAEPKNHMCRCEHHQPLARKPNS